MSAPTTAEEAPVSLDMGEADWKTTSSLSSAFVLSGEESTLPFAEIRALAEAYCPGASRCVSFGRRLVLTSLSNEDTIDRVSERAAFCRFGGRMVAIASDVKSLADPLRCDSIQRGKSFAVRSASVDKVVSGGLGGTIKAKTGARVCLSAPDYVFRVESFVPSSHIGRSYVLAVSPRGDKKFCWRERRPRARGFFLPSAIYPKLARLLVNLSRAREQDIFADPFCGTGSLVIEAQLMGLNAVGVDLTRWVAKGALANLKNLIIGAEGILRADSTHKFLPFHRLDAVATDVPYGRASSTKKKTTGEIISRFTNSLANSVPTTDHRTRYCVMMHPSRVEFDFDKRLFELAERHFLYVHRNLTRAISVLRIRSGSK